MKQSEVRENDYPFYKQIMDVAEKEGYHEEDLSPGIPK